MTNSDYDSFVNPLFSELPGFMINFNESKVKADFVKLQVFDEPRETTLFIYIEDLKGNSSVSGVGLLDFLDQLSPKRIRPNCFIISLCEGYLCTYEKLLRQMWSQRYLDVTVFQLAKETIEKGSFQNCHQVKAAVHRFNPFTDVYEKFKYSRQIKWFPDKLQNMRGYNLTAGIVDYPPYSRAKYNRKEILVDYSGADVLTFKAFSQVLNFSASIVSSVDAEIGVVYARNKSASGMIGKCLNNNINVFITTLLQLLSSKQSLTEYTKMLDWESLYAVVPIFPDTEEVVSKGTSYSTLLVLVIILVIIYVSAHLLTFDSHHWDVFNILQVLLGMPAPREPTTAAARTFFISVIAFSFLYASSFFGGLTSTNFMITSQKEFNTFNDLDNSGLLPIVHPNMFEVMFDEAEGALSNLRKKSLKEENMLKVCGRLLSKSKNVLCILPGSRAVSMTESFTEKGYSPIKVTKKPFWSSQTSIFLEKGSPYVERINQVIMRMIESGLRQKWTGHYSRDLSNTGGTLENRQNLEFKTLISVRNLRRRLVFIAIHGYLVSIVVLIGEILFRKLHLLTVIYLTTRGINIH